MSINYSTLPLFTLSNHLPMDNLHFQFQSLYDKPTSIQESKISVFHKGKYYLNCVSHFLPDFVISEKCMQSYIYPQGFLIMEAHAGYYTRRSHIPSYELRYTLYGEGELIYHGKCYSLKPGEGYWIDCRDPHEYRAIGDDWTCTLFHFYGIPAHGLFSDYAAQNNVKFTSEDCPNFEMLQYQILKSSLNAIPFYEQRLSCLFTILLTELLSSSQPLRFDTPMHQQMQGLILYLQNHYMDDITLDALMHQFGFGRTYLCKNFKLYTGFSVKQYILLLRMNQAKKLLHYTNFTVNDIAESVGFHDTAHFVQVFKKAVGHTPLQYKKNPI